MSDTPPPALDASDRARLSMPSPDAKLSRRMRNRNVMGRLESSALQYLRKLQRQGLESKALTIDDQLTILSNLARNAESPKQQLLALKTYNALLSGAGALSWRALQIREDANTIEAVKATVSIQDLAERADKYIEAAVEAVAPPNETVT